MSKIVQLEMKQITVGQVHHLGTTYDIDWMFRTDHAGNIVECEDSAFVFQGDAQIVDFCQPDWWKCGWGSVDDLMADARTFITTRESWISDLKKLKSEAKTQIGSRRR